MNLHGKSGGFRKGKFLIALAVAAAITIPVSVFAATSDTTAAKSIRGFFGIDSTKLTDQQKETVKSYSQKLADLQKEFIDSMVANGAMTKEQGDAAKQKIDESQRNNETNGIIPGFGGGKGGFEGKGGGFGFGGIDLTKLTDAQKKDIVDSDKKMAEIQKEFINKLVSANVIPKDKGDAVIRKIDEQVAELDKNGIAGNEKGRMDCFGGFRLFGLGGVDLSKLTDDQKNILTDYTAKLEAAQKELIGKMVANGAITKEQGDNALQRIDRMQGATPEKGFPMNGMMKKGRFGMHGRGGFSTSGPAIQPSAGAQPSTGSL